MRLALKIDVDTYHGTREGVPRLARLLERRGLAATFLFSLGPDHTGRAVRRVFRRGFLGKVTRTSVVSHYGLRTLLYGTLLPGPNIGRRCADGLRAVRDAGFEVGVHCWDHVRWQDEVARRDAAWTRRELGRAVERFAEVFGAAPRVHGAAGWQTNAHALRLLDELGFVCASDTRGREPFLPSVAGERFSCPQLPTTLPTFDELIGVDGASASDAARRVLELCADAPSAGHVFTAHAELEGGGLAGAFEALLEGWRALGYEIVSLGTMTGALDRARLPRHALELGTVPGRSGTLAVQGAALAA
ncbi:MAG: polysaccharide deacetylase family protein [Betaproteobacteria bacterium]|nr:polysaccharide deacetylase family protein [Betaproteobacteria bacterium]